MACGGLGRPGGRVLCRPANRVPVHLQDAACLQELEQRQFQPYEDGDELRYLLGSEADDAADYTAGTEFQPHLLEIKRFQLEHRFKHNGYLIVPYYILCATTEFGGIRTHPAD